jgi:16S rRNA (guanine527-N7)-methyltransferase
MKTDIHLKNLLSSAVFIKSGGTMEHASEIEQYIDLLLKWNEKMNLTGIYDRQHIMNTLVLDSLACLEFVPETGNLLDIGSGAGIPGIIVKIFRPELRVYLCEPRLKRSVFLKEAIRTLDLKKTIVLDAPFDVIHQPGNLSPATMDVITIRAVRLDANIINGAKKLLVSGGLFILFSYLSPEDEGAIKAYGFDIIREVRQLGREKPLLYACKTK